MTSLFVAIGGVGAAAAVSGSATAALATLPPGKVVDAVYCDKQNKHCNDVFHSRSRPVKHAPHGHSFKLRCTWFDVGFSKSLGFDKHFCVRIKHKVVFTASS